MGSPAIVFIAGAMAVPGPAHHRGAKKSFRKNLRNSLNDSVEGDDGPAPPVQSISATNWRYQYDNFFGGSSVFSALILHPLTRIHRAAQLEGELLRQGTISSPWKGTIDMIQRLHQRECTLTGWWRGAMLCTVSGLYQKLVDTCLWIAGSVLLEDKPPSVNNPLADLLLTALYTGGKIWRRITSGPLSVCLYVAQTLYKFVYGKGSTIADEEPEVTASMISDLVALLTKSCLRVCGLILVTPVRIIGERLTLDIVSDDGRRRYTGAWGVISQSIGSKQGFLQDQYVSFVPSILGIFTYQGAMAAVSTAMDRAGIDSSSACPTNMFSALAAGTLAYPFDTIRVRLECAAGTSKAYKNWRDCAHHIWKHEGILGFYAGYSVRVLPGVVIGFAMVVGERCT